MKRNIVSVVLLMIFTFGIYYLYLIYKISNEVNELTNDFKNTPWIDLLLTLITGGLYGIYWFYKVGRQIEIYQEALTMNKHYVALLTTIISILIPYGAVVSMAIIQYEINNILDEKEFF